MFEIHNSAGANIGTVSEDELYNLRKEGLIRPTDKIIDLKNGKAIH